MIWNISRIGSKRIVNSFIALFVVLLAISAVSILSINKLGRNLTRMYRNELVPERDFGTLIKITYENRFHLEEIITGISNEKQNRLIEIIITNNDNIKDIAGKYVSGDILSNEQKLLLKQFLKANKDYKALEKNIIDLISKSKTIDDEQQAIKLFREKSYDAFSLQLKFIEKLEDDEVKVASIDLEETLDMVGRVKIIIYLAIFASFGIALFLGLVVGRNILEE